MKAYVHKKDFNNTYNNPLDNIQKLVTIQMSINRQKEKHIYSAIERNQMPMRATTVMDHTPKKP